MSDDTSVRTYRCPSPDCEYSTGGASELASHVNTEHSGEYRRDDWPDTDAGRAARTRPNDDDSTNNE